MEKILGTSITREKVTEGESYREKEKYAQNERKLQREWTKIHRIEEREREREWGELQRLESYREKDRDAGTE